MNSMPENKHLRIVLTVFYIVLFMACGYFIVKYLLWYVLPFIFAYVFTGIIEPVVLFMNKRLKLPRSLAGTISVLGITTLLGMLLYAGLNRVIYEVRGIITILPDISQQIQEFVNNAADGFYNLWSKIPIGITDYLGELLANTVSGGIAIPNSVTSGAMGAATNFAAKVPSAIIFIIVFIVSSVFISIDRENVNRFIFNSLPPRTRAMLSDTKRHMFHTVSRFLLAQLIILCITMVELFIGFSIIGFRYALTMAMVIALIDILPILGTGTVLIPWGLFSLLQGDYVLAFSLILLYVVILFVRQMLEPRIIGQSIGLHPLATLMSMYIGLNIMGFLGMFLGPLIIILLKFLFKNGYLKWPFSNDTAATTAAKETGHDKVPPPPAAG